MYSTWPLRSSHPSSDKQSPPILPAWLHPAGVAAVEHCDERVEALAQFQEAALLHALRFPALRRLVYSTCRCTRGNMRGGALNKGAAVQQGGSHVITCNRCSVLSGEATSLPTLQCTPA